MQHHWSLKVDFLYLLPHLKDLGTAAGVDDCMAPAAQVLISGFQMEWPILL